MGGYVNPLNIPVPLQLISASGAQLRLAYDGSTYAEFVMASSGYLDIATLGMGIAKTAVGEFVELYASNNDGTDGSSCALLSAYVEGPSGGDPIVLWQVENGGSIWTAGIDNSDTDAVKISKGLPGTNTYFKIATTGEVTVNAANALYPIVKTLDVDVAAVGNVGGGTDDLITFDIPANIFGTDGKAVRVKAWGTTANNADAKTVTFVVGSQTVLTTALTTSIAGQWEIEVSIVRTGSNTQDIRARLLQGATVIFDQELTAGTQTDNAAITIKCTGAATSNNDIVQEGMITQLLN